MDYSLLDKIIRDVLSTVEKSKEQIFEIAENARDEVERVEVERVQLDEAVLLAINRVDYLEVEVRKARRELMRVSQNFAQHSEREIEEAYDRAYALQSELALARARETELRQRRDEVDRTIKRLKQMREKAEGLVNQVNLAVRLLEGNLQEAGQQLAELRQRSQMGARIISAQEEERRRVAREIHDGPAQAVANVVMRAEICQRIQNEGLEGLAEELGNLKDQAKKSLTELRKIIFNLRPMALDDLGLVPTLRRYVEEGEGVPVELRVLGEGSRLAPAIEAASFRIVQEALNNAQRHAGARSIKVSLEFRPKRLTLRVQDDGKGFELEKAMENQDGSAHFGLMSMRERVEILGGEFQVTTNPGKGTVIKAVIPVEEEE